MRVGDAKIGILNNFIVKSQYLFSIWTSWIVLTILYLATFIGSGAVQNPIRYVSNPVIGLFVPIGPWNFLFSIKPDETVRIHNGWIVVFPLTLVTLFLGDQFAKKRELPCKIRIFYNLGILFLLTLAVDLVLWREWKSLDLVRTMLFDVAHGKLSGF